MGIAGKLRQFPVHDVPGKQTRFVQPIARLACIVVVGQPGDDGPACDRQADKRGVPYAVQVEQIAVGIGQSHGDQVATMVAVVAGVQRLVDVPYQMHQPLKGGVLLRVAAAGIP